MAAFAFLVVAVLTPVPASSQVAHPVLAFGLQTPSTPDGQFTDAELVPENPAATLWGFLAWGYGRLKVNERVADPNAPISERRFEGRVFGVQLPVSGNPDEIFGKPVGAFAFERVGLVSNLDDYHAKTYNYALAARFFGETAWGVGYGKNRVDQPAVSDLRETRQLGVSTRALSDLYLGLAIGREHLVRQVPGGSGLESRRAVYKAGVGLGNQADLFDSPDLGVAPVLYHIEFSSIYREAHHDTTGKAFGDQDIDRLVLEVEYTLTGTFPSMLAAVDGQRNTIDGIEGKSLTYNLGIGLSRALHVSFYRSENTASAPFGRQQTASGFWISLTFVNR